MGRTNSESSPQRRRSSGKGYIEEGTGVGRERFFHGKETQVEVVIWVV